jgi:hypothetical protein
MYAASMKWADLALEVNNCLSLLVDVVGGLSVRPRGIPVHGKWRKVSTRQSTFVRCLVRIYSQISRFPILFVSLDADPITPLASAVKMSKGFGAESATLLIQRG